MEVLTIIGVIVLIIIIFTGGGILGWLFKGLGAIFEFLLEGWGSCLRVIVWIILIFLLLFSIGIMSTPYKADIIGNVLSKDIENNKQ